MILAEALRKVHDAGQVHGAVSPNGIAVTRTGLELLPMVGGSGSITPYTAPEVVQGGPADSRSDIFSFGAILYEMLTGRPAFGGEGLALVTALTTAAPAPSGSPAVDRLVGGCVAKDPGARWQRMQKLLLELKLLAVAVQRAETPARREAPDPMPAIRAELREMESRLGGRLSRSESSIELVNRFVTQVDLAVKENVASMARFDLAFEERLAQFERTASEAIARIEKASNERISRLEQALSTVSDDRISRIEQAASTGDQRMSRIEQAMSAGDQRMSGMDGILAAIRHDAAALREAVSEDLSMFDKSLKAQTAAIESGRTAMAQTDDLVERVVEALESLQSVVLDQSEERALAAN
jgi:hypothetical protein